MTDEVEPKRNVVFASTPGHRNIVLNFMDNPHGEFMLYGDAYHDAAKQLLEQLFESRQRSIAACPVVFLYRQALELNLKSIITFGNKFRDLHGELPFSDERIYNTHSLTMLSNTVEQVIKYMGWTAGYEKGPIENFADCKKVIEDFNEIDSGSYAFRYPVDTKGKGSVKDHFTFDIFRFTTFLDPVIELMSGTAYALDNQCDLACEAMAEARQAAMEYDHPEYDPDG